MEISPQFALDRSGLAWLTLRQGQTAFVGDYIYRERTLDRGEGANHSPFYTRLRVRTLRLVSFS